jgi:hypothetical protein
MSIEATLDVIQPLRFARALFLNPKNEAASLAATVIALQCFRNISLCGVESRLNHLERLVLQPGVGPQQATKIGRRQPQISRRFSRVACVARKNFGDHGGARDWKQWREVRSLVVQHLILLVDRKLPCNDEQAAQFAPQALGAAAVDIGGYAIMRARAR